MARIFSKLTGEVTIVPTQKMTYQGSSKNTKYLREVVGLVANVTGDKDDEERVLTRD